MNTGRISLVRSDKKFEAGYCVLKANLQVLQKSISTLHRSEREYASSLKYDARKQSYLLGRIAAKNAIAALIEGVSPESIFIDFGVFNFPVIKSDLNYNIEVSISHSNNIGVAIAYPQEHPMGIDIEEIDAGKTESIKDQTTANEQLLLSASNLSEEIRLTYLWTIKEGLSKIFRTGLTMDYKLLEIESVKKTGNAYVSTFVHCIQYKAITFHSSAYVCSIVLPKKTEADLTTFIEHCKSVFESQG